MTGTHIHPTAIISGGARLGSDCRVGAFCVIDGKVELGEGNTLHPGVVLTGQTSVGARNTFYPGAVLGAEPQRSEDFRDGVLRVGSENVFREGFTAQGSASQDGSTVIGDGCRFLAHSHVGHNTHIGSGVVVGNGTAIAGHVVVEDRAFLSGLVTVHQHARIGRLALISAGSFVDRSVLPFTIADGRRVRIRAHNRIGLERAGWQASEIEEVRSLVRAYRASGTRLFHDGASHDTVAARAWRQFFDDDHRGLAPGSIAGADRAARTS